MKTTRRIQIVVLAGLLLLSLSVSSALADDCGCLQGCTQGYWKNHEEAWDPTGYTPDTMLIEVFTGLPSDLADDTMMDALKYGGGPGYLGGAKIMLRAATAALLNTAHSEIEYGDDGCDDPSEIISNVNDGLDGNRDLMLCKYEWMDWYNNQYCTLSPE